MNYDNIIEGDVGEEVKFSFSKDSFKDKKLHCCDREMDKVKIEVELPDTDLKIGLETFRCSKCGKEYLNGEQAKKLDKLLMINRVLSKDGLIYERAVNSDGDNYFIRFPAQLTKGKNKKLKAIIKPLSVNDFFIHLKKA